MSSNVGLEVSGDLMIWEKIIPSQTREYFRWILFSVGVTFHTQKIYIALTFSTAIYNPPPPNSTMILHVVAITK